MFNRAKAKETKAKQPQLNVYEQIRKISKLHLVEQIKACDEVEKERLRQEIHESLDALEALHQKLPDNPILLRVYAATLRVTGAKEEAANLLEDARKLDKSDASLAIALASTHGEYLCQWVNSQKKLHRTIYFVTYDELFPYFTTVSSICYAKKTDSIEKAFALLIQSILKGMADSKSEALKTLTESENTFKTMKLTIPKVILKVRECLHGLSVADAFKISVMAREQEMQHNLCVQETLFDILERSLKFVLEREREFLIEHISANQQQPFVTAEIPEPNTIEKKLSIDSTASVPTAYASSQESAIASLSTQHEMTPELEEPKPILEIASNSKKRKVPTSGLQGEKEPPTKKGRVTNRESSATNNSAVVHTSSTYTATASEGSLPKTLIISQKEFTPAALSGINYSQVAFKCVKTQKAKQNSTNLELSAILKSGTFSESSEPTSSLIEEETNELMRVEITGSNTKKSIGRWGEEFVLGFLEHHYRQKYPAAAIRKEPTDSMPTIENPVIINIDWRNRDNEQFQPIDIVVTKITKTERDRKEVKTRLIEVKTSVNNSADITLSGNEVALMKKYGKAYSIFRVTHAGEDAKITKIKDPWNSIEKEALPIKSITMKL